MSVQLTVHVGANARFPQSRHVRVEPDARGGVTHELRPCQRLWMELKTDAEHLYVDLGWSDDPSCGPRAVAFAAALGLKKVAPFRWQR